ncbi:MAG: AMP-binding protein [Lachnospiraceae bacterium]|nr:AMP-binding protein [Lachnospiraceae bacterium]
MTDTIIQRMEAAANANRDRIAYKCGDRAITYGTLWDEARRCAACLRRQGSSPVVLFQDKRCETVIAMVACLLAGRAYVPVDVKTPAGRVAQILEMTGAELVLTDRPIDAPGAAVCTLRELEGLSGSSENELPVGEFARELDENRVAYMIFTSGSTGEPKGVPITAANLGNFANWIAGISPLCEYRNCNVLNQASFAFDLSVADIYYALGNGHTLIANEADMRAEYDHIFELFEREKINVAIMTPTCMKMCLLNDAFTEENFPEFRCVYFCGERLEKRTVERLFRHFPKLSVINAYGPTEATSAVSAVTITPEMLSAEEVLPVGEIASAATEITVEDGEIVLRGASVFGGYLGGVEGGHFSKDGVNGYRTGDYGDIRDGKLYCGGRKDSQIKYMGYRIELADIESNLLAIDGVADCAVTANLNAEGTVSAIRAFATVEPGGPDAAAIRSELSRRVPAYMVPKKISIVSELPVNDNGKLDRKALKQYD